VPKKYVKKFLDANVSVIDMSSQFRYQPDVPLIIPEINIDELAKYQRPVLIANPNCSSAQLLLILKNIHTEFNISLLNIATYQAVSGTGQAAKDELNFQLTGTNNISKIFPKPIANNVIPQCDVFLDNGFTKEEMKLDWETKKILDENIDVIATCARVPVENGHSEAVFMQVKKKPNLERVISLLEEQEGVKVIDDTQNEAYPTPLEHAQFSDEVCVGRIRTSNSNQNFWISCWIVADNVFGKGAALNAIQILEEMIKRKL
jgi:Aspartate-semialdehyde dehydrogenase